MRPCHIMHSLRNLIPVIAADDRSSSSSRPEIVGSWHLSTWIAAAAGMHDAAELWRDTPSQYEWRALMGN